MEHFQINIFTADSKELLHHIFNAKRVPLEYISLVRNYKNRHEQGFTSVQESVFAGEEVKDFDFYFEYTLGNCGLEVIRYNSLWNTAKINQRV